MVKNILENSIAEAQKAMLLLSTQECRSFMLKACSSISHCLQEGGKILTAGNGGSLADSMHFAEELTGKFRSERSPLPAIALADPTHITCVGNDYGFDYIFSRPVEALGQPGDIFLGLSTSGNSANILRALEAAKNRGMRSICLLGKGGGEAKNLSDIYFSADGFSYSDRIQEVHMTLLHILIEMLEASLQKNRLTDSFSAN